MDLPLFCFDWSCPFDTLYFIAPIYFDNWNEALVVSWNSFENLSSLCETLITRKNRVVENVLNDVSKCNRRFWSKYLSKIFLLLDFLDIVRNFSSCSVENTWIRDWRKYLELKFYKDIYVSKFYRVKQFCKRLWKIWLTSCSWFGQQFQNDIVVSRIFRDARILHQFFLDSYAYVSFTQQFFQLFERLQSNEQSNILTITSNFYFFTITLTTDEQMNLKLWNEKRGTKSSCIMDYLNITITCRPKCRIKILNSILSRW